MQTTFLEEHDLYLNTQLRNEDIKRQQEKLALKPHWKGPFYALLTTTTDLKPPDILVLPSNSNNLDIQSHQRSILKFTLKKASNTTL